MVLFPRRIKGEGPWVSMTFRGRTQECVSGQMRIVGLQQQLKEALYALAGSVPLELRAVVAER